MVLIDKKTYLVDVGLGFRGLRYPFLVDLEKEFNEVDLFPGEKYVLELKDGAYVLKMIQKNSESQIHGFPYPMIKKTPDEMEARYLDLLYTKEFRQIRDQMLIIGRQCDFGRVQIYFEPRNKVFTAFRRIIEFGIVEKINYDNYD